MKSLSTLFFLFFLLLIAGSCSKNDDPEVVQERDDCQTYNPDGFMQFLEDQWEHVSDLKSFSLPPSPDPAGGIYTVKVKGDESAPWIRISGPYDVTVINGGSPDALNSTTRTVSFLAHPNVNYILDVSPWIPGENLPAEPGAPGNPDPFEIVMIYSGLMDCYESNNSFNEAKFIPKDRTIEALANVNSITDSDGHFIEYDDYYKFVVEKSSKIKFELLNSPSDMFLVARIYNEAKDYILPDQTVSNPGNSSLYHFITDALAPGTYYLRIFPNDVYSKNVIDNDAGEIPYPSWSIPYNFRVSKVN